MRVVTFMAPRCATQLYRTFAVGGICCKTELAAEFVRNGVTIIVAHFTPAVRAAMAATKTIPICYGSSGCPAAASTAKLKTTPVLVSGRSCRSYHAEHNPSHFDVPFWG
jgi:hypothetical protein